MSELRDAIAYLLVDLIDGEGFVRHSQEDVADRILAIPEIANGQALLEAKADEMHFGTGAVKIYRVPLSELHVGPTDA